MANDLTKEEFEQVLTDVRKAYRLLYLYQRRVMDLVGFIGNYFGFIYENGGPLFSDPPKNNADLSYWAWDYLGMYNYHFNFRSKDIINQKNVALQVMLVSDTGYYDKNEVLRALDQINLETFNNIEASRTEIHLVLKSQGRESIDYRDEIETKHTSKTEFYREDEDKKFLIGKKYALSEMIDERSTKEVLTAFEKFCSNNNIQIRSII